MTKQESLNKFIIERVMGECWHLFNWNLYNKIFIFKMNYAKDMFQCEKCAKLFEWEALRGVNTDYSSSWSAFGRLWEKMVAEQSFQEFIYDLEASLEQERQRLRRSIGGCEPLPRFTEHFMRYIINPAAFAEAVAKFYGWEEEK